MPQVQHVCVPQGNKRPETRNLLLLPGRETEVTPTGGGGGAGKDSNCDHHLQDTPCLIHLLQVPWESTIGVRQQLVGSDAKPTEGATEVGTTVHAIGKGGHGCPDIGKNLRRGGQGGLDVWVGDVGDDNAHYEGFKQIPPQGFPQADRTENLERERR